MFFSIKKLSLSFCISASLLFPFSMLSAQTIQNIFEPSVEINLSPENPGPNTSVTAEITTNSFDINAAFIGWAINGKVVSQGVGKRSYSFRTGDVGQIIKLEVVLQNPDTGAVISREVTITPGSLELIWESQGYLPPFYEGKARPVLQSMVIFTAIPNIYMNGEKVSSKDLIYTWSKNKTVLQASSGYGKDTLIIAQDFLSRPFTIDLIARTRGGEIVLEKSASINPQNPQLILYEEDPLLGLRLENGITDTYTLNKDELWLRAVPYFEDIRDRNNGLIDSEWNMNDQTIKSGPLEERVVLRRPENSEGGRVNISVTFENNNKLLQSMQESFSILIESLAANSLI